MDEGDRIKEVIPKVRIVDENGNDISSELTKESIIESLGSIKQTDLTDNVYITTDLIYEISIINEGVTELIATVGSDSFSIAPGRNYLIKKSTHFHNISFNAGATFTAYKYGVAV